MAFEQGFVWGAATASYQIEGAAAVDGKGPSVWDMMCRKRDAIWQNQSGEVACDHYHRYREDVDLMGRIGLQAYRASISWPRILPEGRGRVNQRGLDFYRALVDACLEADITPWLTLFHWDYPYELYCRGGWLNPDSPQWFADYVQVVVDALGDRVQHWLTLNEPQCFIDLGHNQGKHAPGDQLGRREVLRAAHHALLAHGRAVSVIRATCRDARVGCALVGFLGIPARDDPADIAAAEAYTFGISEANNVWNNTWWMDPIYRGHYPADGLERYGQDVPPYDDEQMRLINARLDYFCFNIYNGEIIAAGPDGAPVRAPRPTGYTMTASAGPFDSTCLYWAPKFFHQRYGKPIVITENGMPNMDGPSLDGQVHDPQRVDYLQRHLRELRRVTDEGVPVKGYFLWSLLDNFEWNYGYQMRFGLVYVDYVTQQRILKDSAAWYRDVIAANGNNL